LFTEETKNSAKAVVQVSDAASVAYLLDGWEETMLWSYLQGYMGRAYAVGMPPRSAQVLVGSFCFFSGQPEEALVRNIPPDFQEECLLMVPRQSAWQPLIEAVYAERASRIQRYAIKKEPWIFDREKLNNYAESIPEGYRLAPIDEKIYFETKKAEWSHDLTSQFSSYEQYRKYGLGIAALCGTIGFAVIGAALLAVVAVRFVREWKEEARRELERQAEEAEKTEEATDE